MEIDIKIKEFKKKLLECDNFISIENLITATKDDFKQIMKVACKNGNLEIVKKFLNFGLRHIDCYLEIACKYEKIEIVDELLLFPHEIYDVKKCLCAVSENGNLEIFNKIINTVCNDYSTDFIDCLKIACKYGHINIINRINEIVKVSSNDIIKDMRRCYDINVINKLISMGANKFDTIFKEACRCNKIDVIDRMVELGVKNFNDGLIVSSFAGNLQAVNRMIELGANQIDTGFVGACNNGNLLIIDRFIELGAKNFKIGLEIAFNRKHYFVIKKMLSLGATFSNSNEYKNYTKWTEFVGIVSEYIGSDIASIIFEYYEFSYYLSSWSWG